MNFVIVMIKGEICSGIENEVFNRGRYLKRFCTYKKINKIFLMFNYSLLKMPKIVEIG